MKVESDDTIGVGLAAFGMSGRVFHAPLLKNNPHFRIRRVMERSRNEAGRFLPGIPVSRSFDELLGDQSVQVIVVNTPDSSHYALAKESLEAGKHVVVEKPFTQTSAQAEELTGLARRVRKVLTVFQNRRWDGDFLTVQKVLREGVLGRLVDYEAHSEERHRRTDRAPFALITSPGQRDTVRTVTDATRIGGTGCQRHC